MICLDLFMALTRDKSEIGAIFSEFLYYKTK
jgi:hypothetical protein